MHKVETVRKKQPIARHRVPLFAVVLYLLMLISSTPTLARDKTNHMTHHILPRDPYAIVIQWRTLGGLAGRDDSPADLTIRANGSVTVGPRFSQGKLTAGQLQPERLQELLSSVIDDNDFFNFESQTVEEAVIAAVERRKAAVQSAEAIAVPSGPPYIDAGTTVILIAADGKRHEVRYHGLFAAAQDFPEIKALGQLRAIELELLGVAEEIASAASQ
jgi:hypothetical protein